MTRRSTGERFNLVIEDAGATDAEGSTDSRLKRLLKLALRGFRFRVVEIHPADKSGTIDMREGSDECP
jgi:hypothetical protein